jgi:hypothetical protein
VELYRPYRIAFIDERGRSRSLTRYYPSVEKARKDAEVLIPYETIGRGRIVSVEPE